MVLTLNDLKWHHRFLGIAREVASWSKDPSTQVGAVIVDDLRRIVGTGYNGFPRGVGDENERYADRPTKYSMVVHAEVNAVLTTGDKARGSTLYVYPTFTKSGVCDECAKVVIQAGIKRIVTLDQVHDAETAARWAGKGTISQLMLTESGVELLSIRDRLV